MKGMVVRMIMLMQRSCVMAAAIAAAGALGLGTAAYAQDKTSHDDAVPAMSTAETGKPLQFKIAFLPAIADSFSGRVYVMLAPAPKAPAGEGGAGEGRRRGQGEPRFGPNWVNPGPMFSMEAKNWKAGETLVVEGDGVLAFPEALTKLPNGAWSAQAVMRRNFDSPQIGRAAGNAYSEVVQFEGSGADGGVIELVISKVAAERPLVETDRIKVFEMESATLSAFHGRPIVMRAGIALPAGYDGGGETLYPALYVIPGFGGDHHGVMRYARESRANPDAAEKPAAGLVKIVLDPSCYTGHHVFADSANNGPRGEALVKEFIPALEKHFRLVAEPRGRYLTGHSSGGWSSLWLQVTYPDFFNGTWSTAPDPVDFSDFQRVNLYEPGANMYTDGNGNRRPLMRATVQGTDRVLVWYDTFAKMEVPMVDGGQLTSFDAVFSPRGADGRPMAMFDRSSGAVQTDVAKAWEKYDIRLVLERNWATLEPKLRGKLHVFMGDVDTFYLEGATIRLKEALANLNSDAVVEIHEGKDHGSLLGGGLERRIEDEILARFAGEES